MKAGFAFLLALLSLAGAGDFTSIGGYMGDPERVPLGDVLYIGESYPKASGSITATGDISIFAGAKRVTIPWAKAPWDLKRKMQAGRTAFETATKADDSRLGATEQALAARYGRPEPHPEPIPPAKKALLYSPDGLRIVAHFVDGRAECLMIMKREGSFSKEETIRMLSQCGRWTPQPGDMWRREDGGFAIATGGLLRIESGLFRKAQPKPKTAADSF